MFFRKHYCQRVEESSQITRCDSKTVTNRDFAEHGHGNQEQEGVEGLDFIRKFSIIPAYLIFKLATIGRHHGLEAGPEGPADLEDMVLGHGGPLPLSGGLQDIDAGMGDTKGLGLHNAPNAIIQWRCIWRGGRPQVGRPPVGQVVPGPQDHDFGLVARGFILLSVIVAIRVNFINPGLQDGPVRHIDVLGQLPH